MVDFNKVLDLHELHTGVLDIQADIDVKSQVIWLRLIHRVLPNFQN